MKNDVEAIKPRVGLPPMKESALPVARYWLELEHRRDRFDAGVALQLLALSMNESIDARLDLLRIPLRAGPQPEQFAANIASIAAQIAANEKGSYEHRMDTLLVAAAKAETQPDADRWEDPYAPETLRLAAMVAGVRDEYTQAERLAERAVFLYRAAKLRFHFPEALAYGLTDQAQYTFLADPARARQAAALVREGIDAWPRVGLRDQQIRPLLRELSLYLLAAGDEAAAGDLIRGEAGGVPPNVIKRNLGYGLTQVASRFMDRGPSSRPAIVDEWLERAAEYAANDPNTRYLAARAALDRGRETQGLGHLRAMEQIVEPEVMNRVWHELSVQYPQARQLSAVAATRPSGEVPGSAPADIPTSAADDVREIPKPSRNE
jgi:hypothetical protein